MRINYISNLDVSNHSGGWSGMNHNVYTQLKSRHEINLVDKINPPFIYAEKLQSKVLRKLGFRGGFSAFSKRRLRIIAELVESRLKDDMELNFFHGSTPWLEVKSELPYAAYLDASFASYINVYHQPEKFSRRQLAWLFQQEAKFLSRARVVFFSSEWALNDAKKHYGISGNNFLVAGLGGGLETINESFENETSSYFLFVALDFEGKGGPDLVESYLKLGKKFPEVKLRIVGQEPPKYLLEQPGIEYVGRIDKSTDAGKQKMLSLYRNALAFVLPTQKDMTPLVLIEAASVGCPVITVSKFGIPEIVKHLETGILMTASEPIQDQLTGAMIEMYTNKTLREYLCKNSVHHIREKFTWDMVGERISTMIVTPHRQTQSV